MKIVRSEKEAQRIVDGLCQKFSLPKIPVTMRKSLKRMNASAFFDQDTYEIEFEYGIPYKVLHHEFFHYAKRLLTVAEGLEEDLADAFAGLR